MTDQRRFLGINFSCPEGYQPDNSFIGRDLQLNPMCYPNCEPGYDLFFFQCYSNCNQAQINSDEVPPTPAIINTGGDWRDGWIFCFKDIYDRGIGLFPDACQNANREVFVGMCYDRCTNGRVSTSWSPRTCSHPCPPNTIEGGFANCTKVNSYGRGAGNRGLGCPDGFDDWGLWCHDFLNARYSGYRCPSNCTYTARDGDVFRLGDNYAGSYYYGNPFYVVDGITWDHMGVTAPILHEGDPWENTMRTGRVQESCAENWGTLCYPRCDIGFNHFGCCVCSPSCGALRDDGATCHRSWQDRGSGNIPDGCSDPERYFTEGLCYNQCKFGYDGNRYRGTATMCTKTGCPIHGHGETALACNKRIIDPPGGAILMTPNFQSKISEKISVEFLATGIRRIVMNAGIIALCLILSFLLLYTNLTMRSRPLTLPSKTIL